MTHFAVFSRGGGILKRGTKTLWTLSLAAVLGAGLVWSPAAVHAEEKENDGELPGMRDAFQYVEGDAKNDILEEAESFPSYFDLRHVKVGDEEVSYVTPVRLQNPYGTCWGFAAISAAESSLLSSGIAAKMGYDVNTLNLSEKQVAYFSTSHINDTNSPQYGEGVYFRDLSESEKTSGSYRYGVGGTTFMATSLFTGGVGPALEYISDPGEQSERNQYLAYRGKKGDKTYWEVPTEYDDEGNPVPESYQSKPLWYSDQDDWSIPEEYRFVQDFKIKDSLVLPSPAGMDERYQYKFRPEAADAIKKQLVEEHREVSITFYAESYLPGQDTTGKKYMSDKWAHFTNRASVTNHMVTIVGYDDDYPRENFNSTTEEGKPAMPEGDGAFLVKNSWGSELNEFPNNGYRHWGLLDGQDVVPYDPDAKAKEGNRATGYFWLSYYDRSISDPEAYVFCEEDPGDEYIDQMDFMNAMRTELFDEEGVQMANVFEADATARLTSIAVLTGVPGAKVSYEIYLLKDGYETPKDGVLIGSGEESFEFGGYHRIELSDPRVLGKGQKYSVIVKEEVEGKDYVPIQMNVNLDSENTYMVGVINRGESYMCRSGKWLDMSEEDNKRNLFDEYHKSYYDNNDIQMDNFPIKAYLKPVTYMDGEEEKVFDGYLNVFNWQEHSRTTFTIFTEQSKLLTAEFRGLAHDMPASWNPAFNWEIGDEELISTEATMGKGQIKVTGLKEGVTTLTLTAGDKLLDGGSHPDDSYGTRLITIIVKKPEVTDVWIDDSDPIYYDGEEKTVSIYCVVFEDEFYDGVEGVDYQVFYENNVDAGTATVTVEGIGKYGGSETVDFEILPAENTLKAKGRTASVQFSDKAQKVALKDAITFSDVGQGTKTYTKMSGDAKLKVDPKTGIITVGAGLAQGSYDVKIKVSAAGDKNHEAGETEVTVKIKVTAPPKTSYSNEWVKGKWYDKNGVQSYKPTASWKKDKKGWYYSDTSGWYPKNCWQKIDGKWYYFHASGYLAMGEYVKGWWLDTKTGACTWPYKASWHKDSKGWWYGDASGWYARNESFIIDGKKYSFDAKGYWK